MRVSGPGQMRMVGEKARLAEEKLRPLHALH